MRAPRFLPLLLAGLVAGCAESPFVDVQINQTVEKSEDPVLRSGAVAVCHDDATPWAEIEELAREACAKHGYQASLIQKLRWQCRWTAPHRTTFACTLPGLVDELGRPISPADTKALEAWQKRTGKPLPQRVRPGQPVPVPPAPDSGAAAPPAAASPARTPAPAPAPTATAPATTAVPARPLGPADIAGKPAVPAAPPAVPMGSPPPAPTTVAPSGGFTLEPGGWGQSFEE